MNTENITIKDCPECFGKMHLITEGKHQGIYECYDCSYSETCEHEHTTPELAYSPYPPFCAYVEVCDDCRKQINEEL